MLDREAFALAQHFQGRVAPDGSAESAAAESQQFALPTTHVEPGHLRQAAAAVRQQPAQQQPFPQMKKFTAGREAVPDGIPQQFLVGSGVFIELSLRERPVSRHRSPGRMPTGLPR